MSVNSCGESAENQVFRVRKPSVQKNKCFVWINAGKKALWILSQDFRFNTISTGTCKWREYPRWSRQRGQTWCRRVCCPDGSSPHLVMVSQSWPVFYTHWAPKSEILVWKMHENSNNIGYRSLLWIGIITMPIRIRLSISDPDPDPTSVLHMMENQKKIVDPYSQHSLHCRYRIFFFIGKGAINFNIVAIVHISSLFP
jgi:hypothetical protein